MNTAHRHAFVPIDGTLFAASAAQPGVLVCLEDGVTKANAVLSEKDFLRQVVELATRRQWQWVHFLPAMHKDNWRTPFQGPLGKGWPDLILVRRDRILAWELKRDDAQPTAAQLDVLLLLEDAGCEVGVYRPKNWPEIEEALR